MERKFKGICPECSNPIEGTDNWAEGNICIMGFCDTCQMFYGESEVDWEKV